MILLETAPTTTIDASAPATFTCAQCPFARLIEDHRYCCQASQTASDVKRGHWEATISCFEALAKAEAEAEKAATLAVAELEAPIAKTETPAAAITPAPAKPATASHTVTAPAIIPAAATPTAIGENDEPPNRGDNGRGRLQPIAPTPPAKTDKALAAIFGERHKQYQQFLIIREELTAIGIKIGKLIKSRSDVKGWRLDWNGDKAGLFWTIGNGWEVASLKYNTELTGQWEGFDLEQQLECNGIDLEELPADLRVAS